MARKSGAYFSRLHLLQLRLRLRAKMKQLSARHQAMTVTISYSAACPAASKCHALQVKERARSQAKSFLLSATCQAGVLGAKGHHDPGFGHILSVAPYDLKLKAVACEKRGWRLSPYGMNFVGC